MIQIIIEKSHFVLNMYNKKGNITFYSSYEPNNNREKSICRQYYIFIMSKQSIFLVYYF